MHAFIDDSGAFGGDGFFCLAGYVASMDRWNIFSQEWSVLLEKKGIQYLHTSDFLAGKGPYSDLQMTRDERQAAIKEFGLIIRKHVFAGFAVGVDGRKYREILSDVTKKVSAEEFCFERLISRIHRCIRDWKADHEFIECVFDDSEKMAHKFYSVWATIKRRMPEARMMSALTFADDRWTLPLQAADLLACALTQETPKLPNHAFGEGSPFQHLFNDINPNFELQFEQEYWSADGLEDRKEELRRITRHREPPRKPRSALLSPKEPHT